MLALLVAVLLYPRIRTVLTQLFRNFCHCGVSQISVFKILRTHVIQAAVVRPQINKLILMIKDSFVYHTPGRHFECRAMKSREHAMLFDWLIDYFGSAGFSRRPHTMRNLSREAKNIKHDGYFPHGLARRKTHENFSTHERKQLS